MDLARRMALEALLTDEELAAVVARRASSGEPVPIALQALRLASADAVASLFDRMGFVTAKRLKPAAIASKLPKGMMRSLWVLPIGEGGSGVVVAMADPTDQHAIAELAFHLDRPIDPRSASLDKLRAALAEAEPPEAVKRNTRPAAVPPPDEPVGEIHMRRPTPAGVNAELVALASQPRERRATPAYGQPATRRSQPKIANAPKADGPVKRNSRKIVAVGAGTIGAFHGTSGSGTITGYRTPAAGVTPAVGNVPPPPPSAPRDSEAPIPLKRPRTRKTPTPAVPKDALYTVAELRGAADRDAIGKIAVKGMLAVAKRAAFFVVKRGVVQGWEGATAEGISAPGFSREALRNLWIPVTSNGVFKNVHEKGATYAGALSETTADSILSAALGGRPAHVLLAPILVRGHAVAFLYADNLLEPKQARARMDEIVDGAAEALERWIVVGKR